MHTITIDQLTGGLVLPLEEAAREAARNMPNTLAALRRRIDGVIGLIADDHTDLDPDVARELLLALVHLGSLSSHVDDLVASFDHASESFDERP